jgi:DNA-binding response OmpR family regulator
MSEAARSAAPPSVPPDAAPTPGTAAPVGWDSRRAAAVERIAIVDDDPMSRKVVGDVLLWAGYSPIAYAEGQSALEGLRVAPPSAIILDLWMPGLDGMALCRALRDEPSTAHVPIMMLTGSTDEEDQVLGFEVGADDYITKPWSVAVLVARLKAVLRRAAGPEDTRRIVRTPLVVDPSRREVHLEGKPLNLTPTEFRILHALASQPQKIFTRAELLNEDEAAVAGRRSVDVYVHTLRRKLGRHHTLVDTVWGTGYRLGPAGPVR